MTRQLEVIASTLDDALQAEAGGASSVEIVADLSVGGLTPSLDLVHAICQQLRIHTRVIVRPHADSFVYSEADRAVILQDIAEIVRIGAGGIVFGALLPDGTLDLPLMQQVAEASQLLEFTMHRAIDVCSAPLPALDSLRGIAQRVLTSGRAPAVWDGQATICDWLTRYGRDFTIACGGGILAEQIPALARNIPTPEFHVGTAARTAGTVDRAKVAAMVEELADARL